MGKGLAIVLTIVACAALGCAHRANDVRPLPVQVQPSAQVELPQASASWDQDVIKVTGVVRRKPAVNEPIAGHVHVDLLSAEGELLDQVLLRWTPQAIPTTGTRQSTYSANYGAKPFAGAKVRIVVVDDEQEHAFPAPWASGGGGTAGSLAGAPRGMGTPGTLGAPKSGKARGTPGTPRQRSSTPRTPGSGRGGRR